MRWSQTSPGRRSGGTATGRHRAKARARRREGTSVHTPPSTGLANRRDPVSFLGSTWACGSDTSNATPGCPFYPCPWPLQTAQARRGQTQAPRASLPPPPFPAHTHPLHPTQHPQIFSSPRPQSFLRSCFGFLPPRWRSPPRPSCRPSALPSRPVSACVSLRAWVFGWHGMREVCR